MEGAAIRLVGAAPDFSGNREGASVTATAAWLRYPLGGAQQGPAPFVHSQLIQISDWILITCFDWSKVELAKLHL